MDDHRPAMYSVKDANLSQSAVTTHRVETNWMSGYRALDFGLESAREHASLTLDSTATAVQLINAQSRKRPPRRPRRRSSCSRFQTLSRSMSRPPRSTRVYISSTLIRQNLRQDWKTHIEDPSAEPFHGEGSRLSSTNRTPK